MGSSKRFLMVAIATILLPSIVVATLLPIGTVYVVGDQSGWTPDFDYDAWTSDKLFKVGDILVFKYNPASHDVYKVNSTMFNACIAPRDAVVLKSGNDYVELKTAGNKWFLCSTPGHCASGQKLKITVMNTT